MKIFDCFMYFDEEQVLDLRLNVLNKDVDYFVIVESTFNHKGEKRNLLFNKEKFLKFNQKIIYLIYDEVPKLIETINQNDTNDIKSHRYIMNALHRENAQRNFISKGLTNADMDDLILISDVDEIPKLDSLNLKKVKNEIILFKQDMFYYKYNLTLPNFKWSGTKAIKKKKLISAQWLRNIKDKKYPFYRIDTLFSNTKYNNIKFIVEGGWHFTNIKTAKEIRNKLKSYLHHREFDLDPISTEDINEIINKKIAIYDLKVDKRSNKFGNGKKLENININSLPNYLQKNIEKYKEWID